MQVQSSTRCLKMASFWSLGSWGIARNPTSEGVDDVLLSWLRRIALGAPSHPQTSGRDHSSKVATESSWKRPKKALLYSQQRRQLERVTGSLFKLSPPTLESRKRVSFLATASLHLQSSLLPKRISSSSPPSPRSFKSHRGKVERYSDRGLWRMRAIDVSSLLVVHDLLRSGPPLSHRLPPRETGMYRCTLDGVQPAFLLSEAQLER